ncbi:MAG: patatin family protein [Lachnospiraceae bacterium]|nr:patatin family protein [Lachnospiraceae bacterium]
MYQAGLVLEGGGMKGAYTSGVLDFFLEKNLEFSSCYGVSAGAANLCSFLSKQKRRGFRSLTEYMGNKRISGWYSMVTNGNIIDPDFTYDLVPNYLLPFDRKTYEKYEGKAYAVVTNVETGKAEYLSMKEVDQAMEAVKASTALPLVFQMVTINGKKYLDGGLADSIPIQRSILEGNKKNVIVLTKEEGYIRKPSENLNLIRLRYYKYPKVYEVMKERHLAYNETMEYIRLLQKEGKVFVLQPKEKNEISRLEKDSKKMEELYQRGYEDAKNKYDALQEFLIR